MISRSELAQMFDDQFPDTYWKDVTLIVQKCYVEAWSACPGLEDHDRKWLLGFARRALMESSVKQMTESKYKGKVKAELHFALNCMPFITISAGPFQITMSSIDRYDELPESSTFRMERAMLNHPKLFDTGEDSKRDICYGILCHMPNEDKDSPAILKIKFPEADYSKVYLSIDLKERYFPLFENKPTKQEVQINPIEPKLDQKKNKAEGTSG
jgi:hypothetical protein